MNKKGVAEGVDWIIAAGIFLIYLGLVFVFFKPGVKTVYDYEELGNLVEKNIKKELVWNTTKIPIFTKAINFQDESGKSIKLEGPQKVRFMNLGNDIDLIKITRLTEPSKTGALSKKQSIDASIFKEKLHLCTEITFLKDNNYTRLIGFNSPKSSSVSSCPNSDSRIYNICSKEELKIEDNNFNEEVDVSTKCGGIYKIGSLEYIEGLNLDKISDENSKYEKLKIEWGFPEDREFKVVVYTQSDLTANCLSFNTAKSISGCYINQIEPPSTSNVFVKEINTYALDLDGNSIPYIINIRIW